MKKAISASLACVLLMSVFTMLFIFNAQAESSSTTTYFVNKGDNWEYICTEIGADEDYAAAPDGWLDKTDTAEWVEGQAPFTGAWYTSSTANTKLPYGRFTLFLRKTFTVENAAALVNLVMNIIYDEDPIVYLNGKQVWTASGYKDSTYTLVSLDPSALQDGENTICVQIGNKNGGMIFDMELLSSDCDSNGYLYGSGAECVGFTMFSNGLNDPSNVLDNNQNTVCGSGYNASVRQAITVNYAKEYLIDEIFIQCKNEGTSSAEDGSYGTYDLYVGKNLVASGVKAITGPNGGNTVKLDKAYRGQSLTAVITSWYGPGWACVADMMAKPCADENKEVVEQPAADENGNIYLSSATCTGFTSFGSINAPANVLDGNQTTVCGSNYNASVEQSVTVNFNVRTYVSEIFVQCKDEGTTTNEDGSRGTYDIYVVNNGVETLVASGVKAMTGTDGGSLVTLDKSVEGDAIKVVITSWQGSAWACVADISAKEGEAPARDPYDVNGDGMVSIADVSTLLDYLSGAISLEDGVGDIDKDSTINIADVTCLLDNMA